MQYLLIALGVFGLDEIVKNRIENGDLKENEDRQACAGRLLIRKYHNKGAFLNFGQTRQKAVEVASVILTAVLTVFFIMTLTKGGRGLLKTGLSLLLGGAYSNTYDRLKRKYVVDYVSFNVPWEGLRKVVFNIGDFGIMIGALLCVL